MAKSAKRILSFTVCMLMIISCFNAAVTADTAKNSQIRNIIYMIPDGGGIESFYMADAVKKAGGFDREIYPNATKVEKGPMYLGDYLVGAEKTYSASDEVTDSAAAGTALSSGYKTNNGSIGIDADKIPHSNILEACQDIGMNTGLVSTYEWTNATPAAFSAHDVSRSNYAPMSEQIVNQNIDVVLGGGFGAAQWGSIADAEKRGYSIINTREDLNAVKPGDKIWGNLVKSSFPCDIELDEKTPNIAEMTRAAITALDDGNENGFFLMVEGSQVDGGGHSNNVLKMVSEWLAFDEACKVAFEYAKGRNDTLVIVLPDHDTGGILLPTNMEKAAYEITKGIMSEDVMWETTGHTARNGGIFMYVPDDVAYPNGIKPMEDTKKAYEENVIENTDIAPYLAGLKDIDLDEVSKKLFVDVTDMGTYDAVNEVFSFSDKPVSVKRNASYAYLSDRVIDLNGEVAVYINERFYVPQLLLDIIDGKVEGTEYDSPVVIESFFDVYMPETTNIDKWNGKIVIANYLVEKPLNATVKFTAPETFAALEPMNVTIGGGEVKNIEFECPDFDIKSSNIQFDYVVTLDNGEEIPFSSVFKGLAYAGFAKAPVTIDGVLDEEEWKYGIKMRCDDISQVVNITNWKGFRDLSAEFSIMWDSEYMYFNAVVTDEIFSQTEEPGNLWKGDSVQFGVYNDSEGLLAANKAGTHFEEIGLALMEGVPTAYRFRCQGDTTESGLIETDGFEMACLREGDDLTYELKFKWSDLFGYEYTPQIGDVLGFSALINDNDGEGRRGWIEYGSGIGLSKDVNKFVKLLFLDFDQMQSSSDEITVMLNGKKVDFDVKPMLIDDRTMVPVRAIFEALGAAVEWDNDTETVISVLGGDNVTLQINNKTMFVNGAPKEIDVPAMLVNDRTLVPLRAISESYGCTVDWDDATQTVTVTK